MNVCTGLQEKKIIRTGKEKKNITNKNNKTKGLLTTDSLLFCGEDKNNIV